MRSYRWMIGILAVAVLGTLGYLGYLALTVAGPRAVVEAYFHGVVTGDSSQVESVLVGGALTNYRRATAGKVQPRAELAGMNTRWLVARSRMAIAEVTAEVRSVSGLDIQTVRVSLINTTDGWKVFGVEAIPLAYGSGGAAREAEAVQLVREYVTKSAAGDFDAALLLLAGQARTEAEATLSVVKQAQLQVQMEGLRVGVADTDGRTVWVTASYKATVAGSESRPVHLLLEVRPVGGKLVIVKSGAL